VKKLCLIPSGVLHRKLKILERKLIIFETTHVENLSALLALSEDCFSEVTIFIPAYAYEQLQCIIAPLRLSLKINWVIQQQEGNRPFIRRFFRHIFQSSYTHLHIGTLEHNMLLFALYLRKCRHLEISMTLHSINEYNSRTYSGIRDISEVIAKKMLRDTIHHYRVLAPAMADTFKKNFPGRQVSFIPGNFYRPTDEPLFSKSAFSIVIPGTVEGKRRDYKIVINFLSTYISSFTALAPIHIILAGNACSPYGKEIVEALQQLSTMHHFRLSYFMHPLDQDQYETFYRQADIIWAPVIVHTNSLRGIPEISAVTHSPGFITDQIYFGKPAIVPEGLQLPAQLDCCNRVYKDENDLLQIFLSLLSDKNILKEANQKLHIACSYFTKENFVAAFNELMDADRSKLQPDPRK
jgi:hypothetical protein